MLVSSFVSAVMPGRPSLAPSARARVLEAAGIAAAPDASPEALGDALLAARGQDPMSASIDGELARALRRSAVEHGGIMLRAAFEALMSSAYAPDILHGLYYAGDYSRLQ